jgi:S1-C subfamily serine protease
MRDNESEGGWQQPHEYANPWAPRDAGEADQASGTGASPPGNADQDTVAFGVPDGDAGDHGQGSGAQRDHGDPWYGGDHDPGGSQSDPDPGGYGGRWEYGGYDREPGAGGWGVPAPPPRRSRRGHLGVYLAVAALAAGIGAGMTAVVDRHDAASVSGISSGDVPVPRDNSAGSGSSSALNQASVRAKVEPGLVDIDATLKYASETAEGTGMVINPDGLVLTNNHVINGATSVTATLAEGGRFFQARVVGYDSTDDVALLQLTGASDLATVSIGNSAQVQVGTAVLALGNAEGRGGATPAEGVIDGLNRSIQASDEGADTTEDLNHMLETDAQIQQGDSGGALANNAGQVIGMITAANTGSDGQQGGTNGFAIPINSALAIARQIAAGQPSSTVYIGLPGFLGVEVAQSTSPSPQQQAADQQQAAGGQGEPGAGGSGPACVNDGQEPGTPASIAPAGTGALILGIVCGTAAEAGGLVPGDVITSVDGQAVTTPDSLTAITARYHPGDVVSVGWESTNGAEHTMRFTLGDGPAR